MTAMRTRGTRTRHGFTQVSCDAALPDPCRESVPRRGPDADTIRRAARDELGWVHRDGRDLCPAHATGYVVDAGTAFAAVRQIAASVHPDPREDGR